MTPRLEPEGLDPSTARRERGSAMVAAVLASACFALLASQAVRTSRSAVASANAGLVHARLAADAEAGLGLAVQGLSADDPGQRWPIDREVHTLDFDGATLSVTVEDERGKAPLNMLTPAQARVLFVQGGADPARVDALVQAFLDRRDPNHGARSATAGGMAAAGGAAAPVGFETVDDLRALPGMTPELFAAIAPSVTVDAGDYTFEPRTATPLSLAVMAGAGSSPFAAIERQRDLAGERTALDTRAPLSLAGRALTVRVTATDDSDGRATASTLVQLTGRAAHPYVVRQGLN